MIPDAHRPPEPRIFQAHDPTFTPAGTDILVRIYDDGTMTVALRPGRDCTEDSWRAEYDLLDASVLRAVGGHTERVAL